MDTFIKADIFFFISSIAAVVLAIMGLILLYYLIKAGRNLYMLSEALKAGFKDSEEFILDLRDRFEDNPIFRFFTRRPRKRKPSVKKENGTGD
ncbi:MAG: hypothetical protein NTZ38_00855, partial [Candidatus Taylorbacteria bacterium]|nr:hypothetical protein [Candidatus Taylorbacteria bacterium]